VKPEKVNLAGDHHGVLLSPGSETQEQQFSSSDKRTATEQNMK
jgi:hypothetical protein